MNMETIANTTRNFFRMCAAISFSGFTEMAPTLTPLAPAAFFALAIATAFYERLPASLPVWTAVGMAVAVGLVAASGLEAAGFMAFHSAATAYRYGAGWRAGILPGLYLAIGITALWVIEDPTTATIGTALFLLAATVYAARMVMHDARQKAKAAAEAEKREAEEEAKVQEREEEAAADERDWQREQQALAEQRAHEREMKQIEIDARVKLARAKAELAQAQQEPAASRAEAKQEPVECEDCGRSFGSVQAVNAHMRFCTGIKQPAANGKPPATIKE